MADFIQGSQHRDIVLGRHVSYDPGTLPQSGSAPIFVITGGRVAITTLLGQVTTVIQTQANLLSLGLSPGTGTASGTNLGGTAQISALQVGSQLGLPLTQGGVLVNSANAGTPIIQSGQPVICNSGTIYATTSASNTGDIAWFLTYVPIDTGAAVAAG